MTEVKIRIFIIKNFTNFHPFLGVRERPSDPLLPVGQASPKPVNRTEPVLAGTGGGVSLSEYRTDGLIRDIIISYLK